jgi:hypothetical protein
LEHADETDRK